MVRFNKKVYYSLYLMNIDEISVYWRVDFMLEIFVYVEFESYKYVGYFMLIKIIRMETNDDVLFFKFVLLLVVVAELCYYIVNCLVLNVEEFRRENGI